MKRENFKKLHYKVIELMHRKTSVKRLKLITLMAFITMPLSGFVTDIYLPSFPAMASSLSVREQDIQLSLSCYLLSFGISQLFVGSIVDSVGRYKPKLIALFILIISSMVIAHVQSILIICILRVVQGVFVSVLVVATRAFFVDVYEGNKLKYYLGFFTIAWSCGPILAPFFGGYLQAIFGWEANFYFIAFYAIGIFVFEFFCGSETISETKKVHLKENINLYLNFAKDKFLMRNILVLGISYSIVMLFNMAGPFVIERTFNSSSVILGYCNLVLGLSWMMGGIIGKNLMNKSFIVYGILPVLCQFLGIVLLLITGIFTQSLFTMMTILFLIHIACGLLYNCFFTNTMLAYPKNAGTVGGLIGGMVYIITSISNFILTIGDKIGNQTELAFRYIALSLVLISAVSIIYKSNARVLK